MSEGLNGEIKDLIEKVAGLTKAVENIEKAFDTQGSATEERLKHSIRADSAREIRLAKLEEYYLTMSKMVKDHEEVAGYIDKRFLPLLNTYLQHLAADIAREQFWKDVRNRLMERGLVIVLLILIAAGFTAVGLSDFAEKFFKNG